MAGTSCIRLDNCKFYDQCKTTDFGNKLVVLMSALANNSPSSNLINSSPVNLESDYSDFLNRFIRNNFPAANSNLRWKWISSTAQFELYDNTNPSVKMKISFIDFTPTFPISDLGKIKYFTSLETDPANVAQGFYVTGWHDPGTGFYSCKDTRNHIIR